LSSNGYFATLEGSNIFLENKEEIYSPTLNRKSSISIDGGSKILELKILRIFVVPLMTVRISFSIAG